MSIGQDGESSLRVVSQQEFERHGSKLVSLDELPRRSNFARDEWRWPSSLIAFAYPPTRKMLVIYAKDFKSQAVEL